MLHPFSLSPTATWVANSGHGWRAPCLWCAFGIVGLIGGNAAVHTRLGGEAAAIPIHVKDFEVVEGDLRVHFAVPPEEHDRRDKAVQH